MNNQMRNCFIIGWILVFGCGQKEAGDLSRQIEFIQTDIETGSKELAQKVEETGYSPVGEKFIEINVIVAKKTDHIIADLYNEKIPDIEDMKMLTALTKEGSLLADVDSTLLYDALASYTVTKNKDVLALSFLLYHHHILTHIISTFDAYFQHVDYLVPVAIGENFTIRKGEIFKGRVISQAKMVGIKYLYEMDDPQTDEGYIALSANVNSNYDGIIRIEGAKVGRHTIKLKTTYLNNGELIHKENSFDLVVTE